MDASVRTCRATTFSFMENAAFSSLSFMQLVIYSRWCAKFAQNYTIVFRDVCAC